MTDKIISLPARKPPKRAPPRPPKGNGKTALEQKREARIEDEAELERRNLAINEDEQERILADKYDLVAMIAANPASFPLEVAMWNVLLEMVRPATKFGGVIQKTPGQMQADEFLSVVGRVIMVGPSAMEGKTESGIPLKDLTATIKTPEQLIGKYIIHQRHTGSEVWFAPLPGKKLKLITTTEVLAVTTVPSMFMKP
jgi:hypothetical protein